MTKPTIREIENLMDEGRLIGIRPDGQVVDAGRPVLGEITFVPVDNFCATPSAGLKLAEIRRVVKRQAEDDALFSVNSRGVVEAYLQQELRRLHAVIEDDSLGSKHTISPMDD